MSAASFAAAENANQAGEEVFRRFGRGLPPAQAIARVARLLWPIKTDRELAVRTGTSDRACRDLLSGRGGMSLDAVAKLLHSEDGREFLFALMGDASPAWIKQLEIHVDICETRFALEEQRLRIAALEQKAGEHLSLTRPERLRAPLPKRR